MGLLGTAFSGVETAFKIAEEFVVLGTYTKKQGNASYDAASDQLVGENTNVISGVRFLQTSLERQEREASALSIQDGKFLVPSVDMPNLDPGENDFFVLATGQRWNVLASKFVPGKVIHILFGRRA